MDIRLARLTEFDIEGKAVDIRVGTVDEVLVDPVSGYWRLEIWHPRGTDPETYERSVASHDPALFICPVME